MGRIIILPTPMLRKQVGQFNKLFGLWQNSNKNKLFVAPPVQTEGKPTFLMASKGIRTGHITRRQVVMTRHFTEIISDVLANNLKKQLSDIGVTVTSIETKAWNKGVNIFYSTEKFKFDKNLHVELKSIITQLRFAITERRLIGRTPQINFVYDESVDLVRNLESVLDVAKKDKPKDKIVELIKTSTNQIKTSETYKDSSVDARGIRFSAPHDMTNTILGMDYPMLYDEVALKLERGRGESDRMISNVSLASASIPFIRGPLAVQEQDDPTSRITQMQKFIVSQRKKSEHLSKVRRMNEILARDRVKWDFPEDEDLGDKNDNTEDKYFEDV